VSDRSVVALLFAAVALAGCGMTDEEVPTERADGGTLPTDDPNDMTAAEHADAACDEMAVVRRTGQAHGDQLDYIISHTAAADNGALDAAANDWADGIADGDAQAVAATEADLARLCDL
jgi:hypothetical protein